MPKQIVLHVGRSKKPLPDRYGDEDSSIRWYLVAIRDLDGESLAGLAIVAGLRQLRDEVEQEAKTRPARLTTRLD